VPRLDPKALHQLIRHVGLEECGQIISLTTTEQLTYLFDEDLWASNLPGAEEQLDADRFGVWLQVLAESGDDVAAEKLMAMDFDFVTAALSRQILVVDIEALMLLHDGTEQVGIVGDEPIERVLAEMGLTDSETCHLNGYTIF